MDKLNRAQKCSILGPQNLGSRGAQAPRAPLDLHLRIVVTKNRIDPWRHQSPEAMAVGYPWRGGSIQIFCPL